MAIRGGLNSISMSEGKPFCGFEYKRVRDIVFIYLKVELALVDNMILFS